MSRTNDSAEFSQSLDRADSERPCPEQLAWQEAQQANTPETCERFLAQWPDSPYAYEARFRAAQQLRVQLITEPRNAALRRRYLAVRTPPFVRADEQLRKPGTAVQLLAPRALIQAVLGAAVGSGVFFGLMKLWTALVRGGMDESTVRLEFTAACVILFPFLMAGLSKLIAYIEGPTVPWQKASGVLAGGLTGMVLIFLLTSWLWGQFGELLSEGRQAELLVYPAAVLGLLGWLHGAWARRRKLAEGYRACGRELGPLPESAPVDVRQARKQFPDESPPA
jgi:hypothetical protein